MLFVFSNLTYGEVSDGVVSQWLLNESSGTNIIDIQGFSNGTANRFIGNYPAVLDTGWNFTNSSDRGIVPHNDAYNLFTGNHTICANVYFHTIVPSDTSPQTIIAKTISATADRWALDLRNRKLRYFLSDNGGSSTTVSTTNNINANTWYVVCARREYNTNITLYINGTFNNSATPLSSKSVANGYNVTIGDWDTDNFQTYGIIENIVYWNISKNDSDIQLFYDCVSQGIANVNDCNESALNVTPSNNAPSPTLNSPSNQSMINTSKIDLNYTYIDADGDQGNCSLYFGNTTPPTSAIYNLTNINNGTTVTYEVDLDHNQTYYWFVNCTDGTDSTTTDIYNFQTHLYTSIKSFETEIQDTTINSDTYVLLINGSFNLSKVTSLFPRFSFNAQKTINPTSRDLYLKAVFNNETIFDQVVNTVSGTGNIKSTAFIMGNQTGQIGENDFQVYARMSAVTGGAISITNFMFQTLLNKSAESSDIFMKYEEQDLTFSNTVYENIHNFTIQKDSDLNSSTYVDLTAKVSATGEETVYCYFQNGHASSKFIRYLPSAGASGSTGMSDLLEDKTNETTILKLYCKTLNGETVTLNSSLMYVNLIAEDQRNVPYVHLHNESINETNPLNVVAGDNIITTLEDYQILEGDNIEFISTLIMQSTSGAQDVDSHVVINNGTEYITPNMSRSLSSNSDIGTLRMYNLMPVTINDYYNISHHSHVESSANVLSHSVIGIATQSINASEGNVAPSVNINTPLNGSNVEGVTLIDFTVTDQNENLDTCITDLYYANGTFYKNINEGIIDFNYNFSVETDGNYIIVITCNDTLSLEDQDNHSVTVVSFDSYIDNLSISSPTCEIGTSITLTSKVSCYGNENCNITYNVYADNESICAPISGTSGTLNISNGTINQSISSVFLCSSPVNMTFYVNATNEGDALIQANVTTECTGNVIEGIFQPASCPDDTIPQVLMFGLLLILVFGIFVFNYIVIRMPILDVLVGICMLAISWTLFGCSPYIGAVMLVLSLGLIGYGFTK